jgi:hypothetical protein
MMKRNLLVFLVVLLALSVSLVFAQTESSATASSTEDQAPVVAPQVQKVGNVHQVTRMAKVQDPQKLKAKTPVRYDEKGGIIVPDQKKGAEQTTLTARQQQIKDRIENAKVRRNSGTSTPVRKDFKSSEKKKRGNENSQKSAPAKPKSRTATSGNE